MCIIASRLNSQKGAVLLMVLVSVSLLGLMAGIAGSSWQTYMQKSREADLLWKGNQIRDAIGRYYEFEGVGATTNVKSKTAKKTSYPQSLEDLLEDPRVLQTTRHLRQIYSDPMTGEDWELISAPQGGGIMGIRSSSILKPFKQYGFADDNKSFTAALSYSGWSFIYSPQKKQKTVQAADPEQAKSDQQ